MPFWAIALEPRGLKAGNRAANQASRYKADMHTTPTTITLGRIK
jgi:hypothetical protein